MEGFALIDTGIWSIVPPAFGALGLALLTKEVYSSLDWRFCWHGDLYLHHRWRWIRLAR